MCRQRGLLDPANGAKEPIKRFFNLTHLPFKKAYSRPLLVIGFKEGKNNNKWAIAAVV